MTFQVFSIIQFFQKKERIETIYQLYFLYQINQIRRPIYVSYLFLYVDGQFMYSLSMTECTMYRGSIYVDFIFV